MTGISAYSLAVLGVAAAVTWLLRAFPFLLFGKRKELPKIIAYLGKILPPAIMAILILYCLRSINLSAFPFGLAEFFSIAVVTAAHLWKRNMLFSIALGTICYMVLIRTVFPV